ncbi:Zn(II)2Cys6 transcription factor [Penicillium riverlandense]|uniref:Zn(II)2Cys6 transcription factor n=1 Tax=Penicillium riverlandense TaxID=1903569 RepID=UPI002547574B|nr:Zn(II)2Cys6 transcription factor [Penicillium riverlandense]KAJ5825927.1 Zn(II)2Cys6 transcription factor [Penicillium riverlandense]
MAPPCIQSSRFDPKIFGQSNPNPYPYDTTRVTELLRSKRRRRDIKSCFPCRHRKVRCDGHVPCSTCVQRGHAELCCAPGSPKLGMSSGNDGLPRASEPGIGDDMTGGQNAVSDTQDISSMIKRLENIETQISSLKADLQQIRCGSTEGGPHVPPQASSPRRLSRPAKSPGRHFVEETTGATIYLGSHSDPPAALGLSDALVVDQLVPRTYPFTNLWRPEAGAGEICKTLPEDEDIIRYWQAYQTCVYPFYPALVTHEQFNTSLFSFLDRRAAIQFDSEGDPSSLDDTSPSWLALLFAMLACGVQFSNDPVKERDLRTKVFVCSSFQCLRISNFFNNTDMDQIQAMALIGHCLRNNLDTNSAWILMGSTLRLAQSIGLHEETVSAGSYIPSVKLQRKRLWWMLLWQDTFLSFTYDRPPSTTKSTSSIPSDPDSVSGYSFAECIFAVCQVLLNRTCEEDCETLAAVLTSKRRLENILGSTVPSLVDKRRCRTLQDHLERLALRIHVSYAICRLCQLALQKASSPMSDDPDIHTEILATECIDRATDAVEGFLDMHRLSSAVCRSWAFVHNTVSCAITLRRIAADTTVTGDAYRPNVDALVQRLISVLEREELQSAWEDSDTNVRHFGPYSRALKAFRWPSAENFVASGIGTD